MTIPTGFGQINWIMGGLALPTEAQVTMGVDLTGFSGDAVDFADAAVDAWDTAGVNGIQCTEVGLIRTLVKMGPDATGPSHERSSLIGGAVTATVVPPNVALLVRKITDLGGRAGRGRLYLPGLDEDEVNGQGTISGGLASTAQGVFNALATALIGADLFPVVLHGEGSPITTPTPITSLSVDSTVATQRRRLRR
jgi:hypothetical protein